LHFTLNHPATTYIYTLSLHDALPIFNVRVKYMDGIMVSVKIGSKIAGSAKLLEATFAMLTPVALYRNTTPICRKRINIKSGKNPKKTIIYFIHSFFDLDRQSYTITHI